MDADSALNGGDANAAMNGSLYSNWQNQKKAATNVMNQEDAAMKPFVNKLQQTAAQPIPAPPEPKKASPAPEADKFNKDAQGWVTAIAALSALVGARGRGRGTAALKAYAAGVNGVKQGNQQAFDNAYKEWKSNTEAMQKDNEEEMNKYKSIIENRELSESEQLQGMKAVGAQYQNKVMAAVHSADQAFAIYESQQKAKQNADAFIGKMEAKKKEMDKEQEDAVAKAKADPAVQSLADAYHSGVPITTLVKGLGKDAQYKAQAIQDAAQEKYGDFDWASAHNQYMAQGSELRGIANAAGKIELGGEMLDKSIPSMMEAAKKVGLTASTDLNTLYNTAKRHMSDRDFANFTTQLRATTSDYGVFIGRGRQTVHSDEEALKILHDNMGITSLQGFADAVKAERANTTAAIGSLLKKPAETNTTPSVPSGDNVVHWDDLK